MEYHDFTILQPGMARFTTVYYVESKEEFDDPAAKNILVEIYSSYFRCGIERRICT